MRRRPPDLCRLASPRTTEQSGLIISTTTPSTRQRLRLDLAYDGTNFSGWAVQPGRRTVAGVLGVGLAQVCRLDQPPHLVVAGRTDAGVHARGQVCHVDLPAEALAKLPGRSDRTPLAALLDRLAGVLPADVRVRRVQVAPQGFDARFSALSRRYSYRVTDAASGAPPLRRFDVLPVRVPDGGALDLPAMNAACAQLVGLNDFAAFCKRRDGATTIRTLLDYQWQWQQSEDGRIAVATVIADAFCHSMVRALVGGALAVGLRKREPEWLADVMRSGRRDPAVQVVSPAGLVLEEVRYPADEGLALRAQQSRAMRTLDGDLVTEPGA